MIMSANTDGLAKSDHRHLVGCWVMAVLGAMPFAVQPFFLSVMSEALRLAPDQVGLLASADILGVVLASFSGFWWTRRFSRQTLVRLASMSMILGYLGLLFTDTFETVLSLRFLAGVLGHGIAFSLGTALLCRAPQPDRAIAISVVTQISFSTLLLLALPKVLLATDIETVYWTLVAIVLVLLPLLKLTNNSIRYASESARKATIKPLMMWLLVALVCYQLGLSAIWAFIESIGRERQISLEQMGLMLAVILPVSMLGSIFASLLDVRLGRANPVIIATVAGAIGLLIIANTTSITMLAAGFLLHQIAWNFGIAFVYGAIAQVSDQSGTEILAPGSQSLGTALGPILAGILASSVNLEAVIWVSIVGMIMGSVVLFLTREAHSPRS
jgi:predicted MFS family arabinose efflux permease